MSNCVRPHRRKPTRLPHPWDSPGKNTGVGCHCLLRVELLVDIFMFVSHVLFFPVSSLWQWMVPSSLVSLTTSQHAHFSSTAKTAGSGLPGLSVLTCTQPHGSRLSFYSSIAVLLCSLSLWLSGKESVCNSGDAGDMGLIPKLGRFPGAGNDNPLQYSCLENLMDRGAWVTESDMTE